MQDILAAPIDRKTIFRHRTLNDNFFGKLTIYPSGEVYANVNCSVLGNIQDLSLKELLYKEITEGNAWLRIRGNEKPCNQCVNRDLCPSVMMVWSRNQNVKAGETVFTIQPSDSSRLLGKALLPLQGSGKVHVGQRVHIRLNNYPDQEFGYVKGQVASISPAPTEEGMYIVEISLPDGMQTNYGKQLPVSRELKGTADIILADKNVLERLLVPLRKVVEYEK